MTIPPSGDQYEIALGDQRATIVEVGGGVREYSVGGRDVLEPYAIDAICDGAHGAPLIPWPNRLADGRYSFDGAEYRLALTEPEKGNAIHGLVRWRPWRGEEHEPSRVVMRTRIHPMSGFPFTLDLAIAYELTDRGLEVTTTGTNLGESPCPFGAGQHPYLSPGSGLIDECELELDAATRVDTDDERQLPTGLEPVEGTEFDFREARRIGETQIDFAFTDLIRDAERRAAVRLTAADGRGAEMWVDGSYSLIQAFTGDTLGQGRRRTGLGAEPMSMPPNGLQTGEGVIRLEPGESATLRWGARLTDRG